MSMPAKPILAHSPADEPVDWIDESGQLIETLSRRKIRRRNLLHRVTATFVFHPDGRLFLQQRTLNKDVFPGLYDPCVGGTVSSGEDFAANARREVREELGLSGADLYFLLQHRYQDAVTNSVIQVFACVHTGPVTLQTEEVAWGDWIAIGRVEELIREGKVCPDSAAGWRRYGQRCGFTLTFAQAIAPQLKPISGMR